MEYFTSEISNPVTDHGNVYSFLKFVRSFVPFVSNYAGVFCTCVSSNGHMNEGTDSCGIIYQTYGCILEIRRPPHS